MNDIAIRLEKLSKAYRLGVRDEMPDSLIEAAWYCLFSPLKNLRRLRSLNTFSVSEMEENVIWAIKDVDLEVKHGEVLGVIGRNGAGKSTILKLLSKITEPTRGRAVINGRIASLLEVGTGFHPELTGRENIFMNGTILGMRRSEIKQKFDEIVEFAGVARFIDTPIKRYSSGMKVRLAFSVAAHLEPEILVVDEVLAVGDAAFQKKCLGKMGEVAKQGRTILFVSHNMSTVAQLCTRTVVMHGGGLVYEGPNKKAIRRYLALGAEEAGSAVFDVKGVAGTGESDKGADIETVRLTGAEGEAKTTFGLGEPIQVYVKVGFRRRVERCALGLELFSNVGTPLANMRTDSQGVDFGPYEAGDVTEFLVRIPGLPLYPGVYRLEPWIAERAGQRLDQVRDYFQLNLEPMGYFESEKMIQDGRGIVMVDCEWSSLGEEAIK